MHDLTIALFSFNGHQQFLSSTLTSIHRYAPPHKEIVLVWDDYVRWYPIDFDQIKNDTGVEFRVVLQSELYSWPQAIGEWGWIKQQLAKMLCFQYTQTRYTWIIDGDVLLVGDPDLFHTDGRPYLRYDTKPTSPGYIDFIKKYLKLDKLFPYDFVGSTCLFDTIQCQKINEHAYRMSNMSLIDCVHDCITAEDHDLWPFSEFETYGTWIYNNCPDTHILAPRNWNYTFKEHNYTLPIQIGYITQQ